MRTEYSLTSPMLLCPADGTEDYYHVRVVSYKMIPVETIIESLATFSGKKMYQEQFTEELNKLLKCEVRTSGNHSGVYVTVTVGGQS